VGIVVVVTFICDGRRTERHDAAITRSSLKRDREVTREYAAQNRVAEGGN
jgi:hypothetical protein